jgi:hypothetical protein
MQSGKDGCLLHGQPAHPVSLIRQTAVGAEVDFGAGVLNALEDVFVVNFVALLGLP